jgi:rod shape-determining protein MreD
MGPRNRNSLLVISFSFLLAFILTLLPMPEWASWARPAWVLLVLIYWNLTLPHEVNIGTAWFLGLLLDVLNNTLLGEHALAMAIASYFVVKMHARIKMFPLVQQGLCVWLLVLLYQFIIYSIQGFINEVPQSKLYWLSSLISMLLWPWLVNIFKKPRLKTI